MQIVDVQGRICAMPDNADSSQVEAVLMRLPVGVYVGIPTADSSSLPLTTLYTTGTTDTVENSSNGISIMGAKRAALFPVPHCTQQQQV